MPLPTRSGCPGKQHEEGFPRRASAGQLDELCDGGDLAACFERGLTLDDDGGMPKDAERAFNRYMKACNGGYALACARVATYYMVSFPSNERDASERALTHAWGLCKAGYGHACRLAQMVPLKDQIKSPPADAPNHETYWRYGCDGGYPFSCLHLAKQAEPQPPFACDQCDVLGEPRCDHCREGNGVCPGCRSARVPHGRPPARDAGAPRRSHPGTSHRESRIGYPRPK